MGPNAGGESTGIHPLQSDPSMLAKLYNPKRLSRPDIATLDRLVALPERLSGGDGAMLRKLSSWPVSRIVAGGRTRGVLIPAAPQRMQAAVQSVSGKSKSKLIEV